MVLADDGGKEALRLATLRTFKVVCVNGHVDVVKAHYHDSGHQGVGHLCFITVNAIGNNLITMAYNVDEWSRVWEVTTPEEAQAAITLAGYCRAIQLGTKTGKRAAGTRAGIIDAEVVKKSGPKRKYEVH